MDMRRFAVSSTQLQSLCTVHSSDCWAPRIKPKISALGLLCSIPGEGHCHPQSNPCQPLLRQRQPQKTNDFYTNRRQKHESVLGIVAVQQAHQHAITQTHKQTSKQASKQTYVNTHIQTYESTNTQAHKYTTIQTCKQTNQPTQQPTNNQTNKQTNKRTNE